jgi:hypothetical protein
VPEQRARGKPLAGEREGLAQHGRPLPPASSDCSVARWSRPILTDNLVEKAPFTDILAILYVVEGCNKA